MSRSCNWEGASAKTRRGAVFALGAPEGAFVAVLDGLAMVIAPAEALKTPYSFRPASIADLPRLRRWLMTPEVARWWGGPRTEFERSSQRPCRPARRLQFTFNDKILTFQKLARLIETYRNGWRGRLGFAWAATVVHAPSAIGVTDGA